jgi:hypothetical protein
VATPSHDLNSPPKGGALRDLPARRRRRLGLPIVTLAVALGLWVWSSRVAETRDGQVEEYARALLADAAPPAPSEAGISGTQPVIAALVRRQLAALVADGSGEPTLTIHSGDLPGAGELATHHAVVASSGGRRVVLRLRHAGEARSITIVGVELERTSPPDGG